MADQEQGNPSRRRDGPELRLLGPARLVSPDGGNCTPKSRKARALVAIVALSRSPVPRARLIDMLWGDRAEEQARASLRQALYELRDLSSDGHLLATREAVSVGDSGLVTDVGRLLAEVEALDAAGLAKRFDKLEWPVIGGLDGLTPELDEWLRDERQRLTARLTEAGRAAAERALASNDVAGARTLLDRLERIEPLDEELARLAIAAAMNAGDRASAAQRHARLAKNLETELGIVPSPETTALLDPAARPKAAAPPPLAVRSSRLAARVSGRQKALLLGALCALVLAAWWLFRSAATAASPSVAVLPFNQLGEERSHVAAGMSDEILNMLGKQGRFRVIGRMSAEQVGESRDPLAIARKLGISHLLDGSVTSAGGKLIVIANLIRVDDGTQLWSEKYESDRKDVIALQTNIAGAVASRLARSLGTTPAKATSPEVYDRYLAARQLLRERREPTLVEAARLLREAIRIDPDYAPALAELSQVNMLLADHPISYGRIPIGQARSEAEVFARRAIALDPGLGDAYAALGFLTLSDASAEPLYRKAVELSPQRSEFHRWHGQSLTDSGHYDEALARFRRAVEIDPLWGLNYDHLAGMLIVMGRRGEAQQLVRRFLSLSTDDRAKRLLVLSMARSERRFADAYRQAAGLYRDYPTERQMRFNLASSAAQIGDVALALKASAADPLGTAVLTEDWPAVTRIAASHGMDFWDVGLFWDANARLVEAGHGSVIVRLYRQSKATLEKDRFFAEEVAQPSTVVALRQAGMTADADRMLAIYRDRMERLPPVGQLRFDRDYARMVVLALGGDKKGALAIADRLTRTDPLFLPRVPGRTMLHDPAFAAIARDSRFAAYDERVRHAVNRERAKIGLGELTIAQWRSRA
jgi:DNA-binding SARP family transcriptional activator/TolB-like protein/Tfp pilus assembly protein PilF